MTLHELTHDERIALAALMEISMMANGHLSEQETAQVDEVANELGEEAFRALLDEAETRFPDRKGLQDFLKTISRQEAREFVYETVLTDALTDLLPHSEAEFLDWLAQEWRIPMVVEGEAEAAP